MVKMIMHGCNGAMGQVITKLASEDNDAEIVAGIDCADNRENPYPVFTSCDACDVDADVIVDFSVAQAVDGVLAYALKRKMPLVLCTTGLSDKQLEDVKAGRRSIQEGSSSSFCQYVTGCEYGFQTGSCSSQDSWRSRL